MREPLEGLVAGLAAVNRTDAQSREIDGVVEAGRTARFTGDLTPLPALNTRFHALLVESAGNELLADVLDGLTHVIEWMYTRRVRERGLWSWEEHAAIAACVAARDRDGAQALACEHIRNARDAYFATPAET